MDKTQLAWMIVVGEFLVITIVILATFISKLILYTKDKRQLRIRMAIEVHLTQLINAKASFSSNQFPSTWHRLDILLAVVKKYDFETQKSPVWENIKKEMLVSIMLPLARQGAISNDWVLQFYAAQTFELYAEAQDKVLITDLINSKWPVVMLAALHAAIQYGAEEAFDNIIQHMQDQPQLTQSLYLQVFTDAPLSTRPYITKYLKESSNPYIRLTCYRILLNYQPDEIDWNINQDIHADDIDVKLAALKFLAYTQKEAAIPILIDQIKNKNWETKVIVLDALGYLKAEDAIIPITACLRDENWWVSLTAGLALKNMGEKGEQALTSDKVVIDAKAFEVARHVLKRL